MNREQVKHTRFKDSSHALEYAVYNLIEEDKKEKKQKKLQSNVGVLEMNLKAEIRFIGTVTKADEEKAELHIFPEFCAGLKDVTDFSHLIILYWMHLRDTQKDRQTLLVIPKRHNVNVETGVFSCRSPSRPNPIGLCIVELLTIRDCTLTVKGLDAEKESPIIDIKPYLPKADSIPNARVPEWTSHGPLT